MAVTWKFTSLDQMGAFFDRKAQDIRGRVPNASPQSKRIMQAEAHAYEQAAMIAHNSIIEAPEEALASLDAAIAECAKPLPRHA